ncbi:unnamed protein product [Microthlaspi erraticum]|uniref:TF-B3 domain-containing protein n=1 Tax=Microthlaspi erraticum TaxID=1685480 RepID=A0A6D2JH62_9BRAS|nr:unnamed protein product [Microthlaspi erraticum]
MVFVMFLQNLPLVPDEISGRPLPKRVTVKSVSSGNVWRMEMIKNGEGGTVFLRNGWKNIAKDENLKESAFLVFEFDGYRVFHFCVYDHSTMCKRMRTPTEKEVTEVESEEEEEEESESEETDDEDDDDDDYDDDDEESKEWLADSAKRKERAGGTRRRRSYLETESEEMEEYLDDKKNPHFPMDITMKRARIPAKRIKDYNLRFPELVVVSDKIGKLKRKISVWNNKSVIINGLGSITRRNYVKSGDRIICELKMVDGNHGMVKEVKIHVIKFKG